MASQWCYRELALGSQEGPQAAPGPAWTWQFEAHEVVRDTFFPIFADGCCDVVWHGEEGEGWRTYLLPPTVCGLVLPIGPHVHMMGLRLLPGQVQSLFGCGPQTIAPQGVVLDEPRWANPQAFYAASGEKLTLSRLDHALQGLMAGDSPATTSARFNINARTLRRKVFQATGCSPKGLQRRWRLRRALLQAGHEEHPDWSDMALKCGYADQAHLNRESRALMECTPTDLHHLLKQGHMAVSFNTVHG